MSAPKNVRRLVGPGRSPTTPEGRATARELAAREPWVLPGSDREYVHLRLPAELVRLLDEARGYDDGAHVVVASAAWDVLCRRAAEAIVDSVPGWVLDVFEADEDSPQTVVALIRQVRRGAS